MKRIMIIVTVLVLLSFSFAVTGFDVCESEPGHFQDSFGNGYCVSQEVVFSFFEADKDVCVLDTGVI